MEILFPVILYASLVMTELGQMSETCLFVYLFYGRNFLSNYKLSTYGQRIYVRSCTCNIFNVTITSKFNYFIFRMFKGSFRTFEITIKLSIIHFPCPRIVHMLKFPTLHPQLLWCQTARHPIMLIIIRKPSMTQTGKELQAKSKLGFKLHAFRVAPGARTMCYCRWILTIWVQFDRNFCKFSQVPVQSKINRSFAWNFGVFSA